MSKEEHPVVVPIRGEKLDNACIGSLVDQLHKVFADEGAVERCTTVTAAELHIEGHGNVQISKDRAAVQVIKGNNNIQIAGFCDSQVQIDEQWSCADNQCKNSHEGRHDGNS